MEWGYTVDSGPGNLVFGKDHQSKWARGNPTTSVLSKLSAPKNTMPTATFRCTSCGYLESYADPKIASRRQWRFSLLTLIIIFSIVSVLLAIISMFIRF
jgi:hypothetical protein